MEGKRAVPRRGILDLIRFSGKEMYRHGFAVLNTKLQVDIFLKLKAENKVK